MPDPTNVLNTLLEAEYTSLVRRLAEAEPFIPWTSAGDGLSLDRMIVDQKGHERDLVAMILKLRGSPRPPAYHAEAGAVAYLDLSHLIPAIIADERRLVAAYEHAGSAGHPNADALVSQILEHHRRHLADLQAHHANLLHS